MFTSEELKEAKFYFVPSNKLEGIYATVGNDVYHRSVIGYWQQLRNRDGIEELHLERFNTDNKKIDLEQYVKDYYDKHDLRLKTFIRTGILYRIHPNRDISRDRSFMDEKTLVLMPLPDGSRLAFSDFIKEHCYRDGGCPIDIIPRDYFSDNNYELKNADFEADKKLIDEFKDDVPLTADEFMANMRLDLAESYVTEEKNRDLLLSIEKANNPRVKRGYDNIYDQIREENERQKAIDMAIAERQKAQEANDNMFNDWGKVKPKETKHVEVTSEDVIDAIRHP